MVILSCEYSNVVVAITVHYRQLHDLPESLRFGKKQSISDFFFNSVSGNRLMQICNFEYYVKTCVNTMLLTYLIDRHFAEFHIVRER